MLADQEYPINKYFILTDTIKLFKYQSNNMPNRLVVPGRPPKRERKRLKKLYKALFFNPRPSGKLVALKQQ